MDESTARFGAVFGVRCQEVWRLAARARRLRCETWEGFRPAAAASL
ncbi:hypothetical protein [Nodularia spumigena]|nr:hypothetical protein [Nodularia spumigena]MEA5557647.1 hypothetical protein [Nodularia spumigena CH309]